MPPPVATPGLTPFDAFMRQRLVLNDPTARHVADVTSSVFVGLALAEPMARDLFVNGVADGNWRGAAGSMVIDGATQVVSEGVNLGLKGAFQGSPLALRPLAGPCGADPGYDSYCGAVDTGMPSGHSQAVATALGIGIAHRIWDHHYPTCNAELITLGAATLATQYLRVASDKHTVTQTLVGGGLGVGIGIGVPALAQSLGLGYDHWNERTGTGFTIAPTASVTQTSATLGVAGTW